VHFDRGAALRALVSFLILFAASRSIAAENAGRPGTIERAPAHSVATEGEYAVVGAPWLNGWKGGAYVLARDGKVWREVQRLLPEDLGRYDHFGASVSIDGDEIRVAAPWHNLLRGAVYVYRRSGDRWLLQEKKAGRDLAPDPRAATLRATAASARSTA
jgi:hypothetical protein